MKTFIKWFGNKSRYRDHLISFFPAEFNTYIEPFVGSGAVFLQLRPKKWIINDINRDLTDLWMYLKKSVHVISKTITSFSDRFMILPKNEQLSLCRSITDELSNMRRGPSRAAYYLLMKYCVYFGSLIKDNKYYFRGLELNFMNPKYIPIFTKQSFIENLMDISKFMKTSDGTIYNRDYVSVLELAKKGDFVFIDPPYVESHHYDFEYNIDEKLHSEYDQHGHDHLRKKRYRLSPHEKLLLGECRKLDKRKVKWLMTQADTPMIRNVFRDYHIGEMKVYRRARKQYAIELIIKNFR